MCSSGGFPIMPPGSPVYRDEPQRPIPPRTWEDDTPPPATWGLVPLWMLVMAVVYLASQACA